tara:strand:+ start:564 stop:680 length:117 start_codon:yes stop_codon:yes gene_type:complete
MSLSPLLIKKLMRRRHGYTTGADINSTPVGKQFFITKY